MVRRTYHNNDDNNNNTYRHNSRIRLASVGLAQARPNYISEGFLAPTSMKIVWIVLAAAVILSPAAASSANFDADCTRPTSECVDSYASIKDTQY